MISFNFYSFHNEKEDEEKQELANPDNICGILEIQGKGYINGVPNNVKTIVGIYNVSKFKSCQFFNCTDESFVLNCLKLPSQYYNFLTDNMCQFTNRGGSISIPSYPNMLPNFSFKEFAEFYKAQKKEEFNNNILKIILLGYEGSNNDFCKEIEKKMVPDDFLNWIKEANNSSFCIIYINKKNKDLSNFMLGKRSFDDYSKHEEDTVLDIFENRLTTDQHNINLPINQYFKNLLGSHEIKLTENKQVFKIPECIKCHPDLVRVYGVNTSQITDIVVGINSNDLIACFNKILEDESWNIYLLVSLDKTKNDELISKKHNEIIESFGLSDNFQVNLNHWFWTLSNNYKKVGFLSKGSKVFEEASDDHFSYVHKIVNEINKIECCLELKHLLINCYLKSKQKWTQHIDRKINKFKGTIPSSLNDNYFMHPDIVHHSSVPMP